MMEIRVNGEKRDATAGTTLRELIFSLSLVPERIAVEHNREVVRQADWNEIELCDGDQIEVVHFVGGGCESQPFMSNLKSFFIKLKRV